MLKDYEIERLKEMQDEGVNALIDFYEANTKDIVDDFLASLKLTLFKINKDLKIIRGDENGQFNELEISILNRDDKLFERIGWLIKNKEDIVNSMKHEATDGSKPVKKQSDPFNDGAF